MHILKRALVLAICFSLAFPVNIVLAAPSGGKVAAGKATIKQSGAATTIKQSSKRAIVNWKTFDINKNETVTHIMPGKDAAALHRVTGGKGASKLAGELKSNGNIFLVNPQGVVIRKGAKINTGGFVGTTSDIDNAEFMKGNYVFDKPGRPGALILNQGHITGFAALVAPSVRNEGVIAAKLGKVALGSGDVFKLDFYGDDLINFTVSETVADSLYTTDGTPLGVENTGTIKAEGGVVLLTASRLDGIVASVVNNGGLVDASSAELRGGRIVFKGEGENVDVVSTGVVTASSEKGDGGVVRMIADGGVTASGTIEAKGAEKGGRIDISGKKETLIAEASIDAEGKKGGLVRLGGEFQGGTDKLGADAELKRDFVERFGETERLAPTGTLTMDAASEVNAGTDGTLIAWSEGETNLAGTLRAKYLETSGNVLTVSRDPVLGKGGTWLLDPANVEISQSGDPNVNAGNISSSWLSGYLAGDVELWIMADNSIRVRNTVASQGRGLYLSAPSIYIDDDVSLIGAQGTWYDDEGYRSIYGLWLRGNSITIGNNATLSWSDVSIGASGSVTAGNNLNISATNDARFSAAQLAVGNNARFVADGIYIGRSGGSGFADSVTLGANANFIARYSRIGSAAVDAASLNSSAELYLVGGDVLRVSGNITCQDDLVSLVAPQEIILAANTRLTGPTHRITGSDGKVWSSVFLSADVVDIADNVALTGYNVEFDQRMSPGWAPVNSVTIGDDFTVNAGGRFRVNAANVAVGDRATLTALDYGVWLYQYESDSSYIESTHAIAYKASSITAGNDAQVSGYGIIMKAENLSLGDTLALSAAENGIVVDSPDVTIGNAANIQAANFDLYASKDVDGTSIEGTADRLSIGTGSTLAANWANVKAESISLPGLTFAGDKRTSQLYLQGSQLSGQIVADAGVSIEASGERMELLGPASRTAPIVDAPEVRLRGDMTLPVFAIKAYEGVAWSYDELTGEAGTDPHIFGVAKGKIGWSADSVRIEFLDRLPHDWILIDDSGSNDINAATINASWLAQYIADRGEVWLAAEQGVLVNADLVFSDGSLTLWGPQIGVKAGSILDAGGEYAALSLEAGRIVVNDGATLSAKQNLTLGQTGYWPDFTGVEIDIRDNVALESRDSSVELGGETITIGAGSSVAAKSYVTLLGRAWYSPFFDIDPAHIVIGAGASLRAGRNITLHGKDVTLSGVSMQAEDISLKGGRGTLSAGFPSESADKIVVQSGVDGQGITRHASFDATGKLLVHAAAMEFSHSGPAPVLTADWVELRADGKDARTGELPEGTQDNPFIKTNNMYFAGGDYLINPYAVETKNLLWADGKVALTGAEKPDVPHIFGVSKLYANYDETTKTLGAEATQWPFETVVLWDKNGNAWQAAQDEDEDEDEPAPPVIEQNNRQELSIYMAAFLRMVAGRENFDIADFDAVYQEYVAEIQDYVAHDFSIGADFYLRKIQEFDYESVAAYALTYMQSQYGDAYQLAINGSAFREFAEIVYMTRFIEKGGEKSPSNSDYALIKKAYLSVFNGINEGVEVKEYRERIKDLTNKPYTESVGSVDEIKKYYGNLKNAMLGVIRGYNQNEKWNPDPTREDAQIAEEYNWAVNQNMLPVLSAWSSRTPAGIDAFDLKALGGIVGIYSEVVNGQLDILLGSKHNTPLKEAKSTLENTRSDMATMIKGYLDRNYAKPYSENSNSKLKSDYDAALDDMIQIIQKYHGDKSIPSKTRDLVAKYWAAKTVADKMEDYNNNKTPDIDVIDGEIHVEPITPKPIGDNNDNGDSNSNSDTGDDDGKGDTDTGDTNGNSGDDNNDTGDESVIEVGPINLPETNYGELVNAEFQEDVAYVQYQLALNEIYSKIHEYDERISDREASSAALERSLKIALAIPDFFGLFDDAVALLLKGSSATLKEALVLLKKALQDTIVQELLNTPEELNDLMNVIDRGEDISEAGLYAYIQDLYKSATSFASLAYGIISDEGVSFLVDKIEGVEKSISLRVDLNQGGAHDLDKVDLSSFTYKGVQLITYTPQERPTGLNVSILLTENSFSFDGVAGMPLAELQNFLQEFEKALVGSADFKEAAGSIYAYCANELVRLWHSKNTNMLPSISKGFLGFGKRKLTVPDMDFIKPNNTVY